MQRPSPRILVNDDDDDHHDDNKDSSSNRDDDSSHGQHNTTPHSQQLYACIDGVQAQEAAAAAAAEAAAAEAEAAAITTGSPPASATVDNNNLNGAEHNECESLVRRLLFPQEKTINGRAAITVQPQQDYFYEQGTGSDSPPIILGWCSPLIDAAACLGQQDQREHPSPQLDDWNRRHNQRSLQQDPQGVAEHAASAWSGRFALDSRSFPLVLLTILVVMNSSTVLLGRYTRNKVPASEQYSAAHVILLAECFKFVASFLLEFITTARAKMDSSAGRSCWSIQRVYHHQLSIWKDATSPGCLTMLIPAVLYWVQNHLVFIALSNLSAPVFQVVFQCRLVITALASVSLLQRTYCTRQWICLAAISLGVAVIVLSEQQHQQQEQAAATAAQLPSLAAAVAAAIEKSRRLTAPTIPVNKEILLIPKENFALGMTANLLACTCSAVAGVYFEKLLKRSSSTTSLGTTAACPEKVKKDPSIWIRNIQLAFFSILTAVLQHILSQRNFSSLRSLSQEQAQAPAQTTTHFLHGFTVWVWLLLIMQSGGGLLVAAIIKYADNVLKGIATAVATVLSAIVSCYLFGTVLTPQFLTGATTILTAVYFFSNPIPTLSTTSVTTTTGSTSSAAATTAATGDQSFSWKLCFKSVWLFAPQKLGPSPSSATTPKTVYSDTDDGDRDVEALLVFSDLEKETILLSPPRFSFKSGTVDCSPANSSPIPDAMERLEPMTQTDSRKL